MLCSCITLSEQHLLNVRIVAHLGWLPPYSGLELKVFDGWRLARVLGLYRARFGYLDTVLESSLVDFDLKRCVVGVMWQVLVSFRIRRSVNRIGRLPSR